MSVNSRLKAIQTTDQRKAFQRYRILESSYARTETVDIIITSRNGDRKIMQSIRMTNIPPTRISGTS